MSRLINFAGSWDDILDPPPRVAYNRYILSNDFAFPDMDSNDGSYITIPTSSTGSVVRYNSSGTQVWSKGYTDIEATCTEWTYFWWLDTVDHALWVWTYKGTGGVYYLAKIALSDGTITNVGNTTAIAANTFSASKQLYVKRASMGSGNFTIINNAATASKVVISSSDGSVVSGPTSITQDGVTLGYVYYVTSDGTIYQYYNAPYFADPTSVGGYVQLIRGGRKTLCPISPNCPGGKYTHPKLWGGYIAQWVENTTYGAGNPRGGVLYNITEWDDWYKRLIDYYSPAS